MTGRGPQPKLAAWAPLKDVLLEIWQADAAGGYNHPADRRDKPPTFGAGP